MAKRNARRAKRMAPKRRSMKRRSMGSVNLQDVAATLAGAVASRFIVNSMGKILPQVVKTPTSKAIGQIALGFLTKPLAGLVGSKSPMVDAFGKGMMLGGGYELLKVSVPAAFGQAEDQDVIVVNGMDISEINGMDDIGQDISEINGMDEIGNYYGEDYND
jgi:hypothetical protein